MQVEMRMLIHSFTKDIDLCDSFKNSFIFVFVFLGNGNVRALIYRRDYSNKDVCLHNLGDNCIVFEHFTASIGDLLVAN
jgi:hypothetical protein